MRARRETLVIGVLCAAWYALSSASNVVGKLALTEFPFPLTVALVQLAATAVCSVPALALCGAPPLPSTCRLSTLLPLAFAKFLTTVFSQFSIWKVPVSYAHTVKATTPLWTAGLAWALFGERQSRGVQAALVVIAGGVALASATELNFRAAGLGAALASAALLSLQHLLTKRLMQGSRAHPLRLLQALSALALVALVPVWAMTEGGALATWSGAGARTVALLAGDGVLAWLQAVAAFSVLARVTPLAYAVASAAKRAAVVLASLAVLRNPAPPPNIFGMALAVLGVLLYNRAKLRRSPSASTSPLLPV